VAAISIAALSLLLSLVLYMIGSPEMRADEKSGEDRSPLLRLLHVLIEQAESWVARDHAGQK
jgi:hypothetical protein